jgi:16S rRNA (guanine(966)-N(2))-methyltransferase RsmD
LDVRPTADRLRETLFNVLTAGNPGALEGSVWVDLYAGTGAVGIEAVSRGAGKVYFVESATEAAGLIRKNLASLRVESGFEVLRMDARRGVASLEGQVSANVVYLDPPYQLEAEYEKTLEALSRSSVVGEAGLVIAEHLKRYHPGEAFGALRRFRKLEQGDAALSFYRREA